MLFAGISALTAKETGKYTLKELDDVQQSEREKAAVTAAIEIPTGVTRDLAAKPGPAK
jgi:hypothetical protein